MSRQRMVTLKLEKSTLARRFHEVEREPHRNSSRSALRRDLESPVMADDCLVNECYYCAIGASFFPAPVGAGVSQPLDRRCMSSRSTARRGGSSQAATNISIHTCAGPAG